MSIQNNKSLLTALLLLCPSWLYTIAQVDADDAQKMISQTDSVGETLTPPTHQLHAQHRGYDDRIVLRWAPGDYVSWRMGLTYGYSLNRLDIDQQVKDSLVKRILPLSEADFIKRFGEADTVAMAAGELIYGTQPSFDGSLSFNQIMEEQKGIYSFAMLICDMRPDVAEAMGLCYIDRTARPKARYNYSITPLKNDSSFIWPGIIEPVAKLGEYKRRPYEYTPSVDTVMPPATVRLSWPNIWYSTYDIERSIAGHDAWQKLNLHPWMTGSPIQDEKGNPINIYYDETASEGEWEYRIIGRDLFGEPTLPGPTVSAIVPDLVPPSAPLVGYFEILPGDTLVSIHFSMPVLDDDLAGVRAYYYNKEKTGDEWLLLEGAPALPTDTVLTVNVRDLPTGNIALAAFDRSGNEGYSLPLPFHVIDRTPPQTPRNLRAAVSPQGIVVLRWSPSPDLDVHYYNLFFANDSTHTFYHIPRPMTRDTIALDTLDLSAMQPYRYYQVQAVDWNGNESFRSKWLQVARPNFKAPQPCILDSVWKDEDHVYSRWIPSPEPDIREFRILRRKKGDKYPVLIKTLPADSVRADGRLYLTDSPLPDRERRYYYSIQSINNTGTASAESGYAQYLFTGPSELPISLRLGASYREDDDCVALAWEVFGLREEYLPGGYFIIYRRLPGQSDFEELTTQRLTTLHYFNRRFPKDVEIEYFIQYLNEDTRYSPISNIVTVTAPSHP